MATADDIDGPEFEVWLHLWTGIDTATDELRVLNDESRKAVEQIGSELVNARKALSQAPDTYGAKLLLIDDHLLANPWVRHAAEIEVASTGIWRSEQALKRFMRVKPAIVSRPIPERAIKYVAEVVQTYMFGFDAACIALCRATIEQLLKDELLAHGLLTEPQIRRERPTAGSLLAHAKRAGLLTDSTAAAERVVKKGDTVLHSFVYDDRVIDQQALDSVTDLVLVVAELYADTDKTRPSAI
jgi:hypothetical protein